jgi:hypothetical protein
LIVHIQHLTHRCRVESHKSSSRIKQIFRQPVTDSYDSQSLRTDTKERGTGQRRAGRAGPVRGEGAAGAAGAGGRAGGGAREAGGTGAVAGGDCPGEPGQTAGAGGASGWWNRKTRQRPYGASAGRLSLGPRGADRGGTGGGCGNGAGRGVGEASGWTGGWPDASVSVQEVWRVGPAGLFAAGSVGSLPRCPRIVAALPPSQRQKSLIGPQPPDFLDEH